MGVDPTQDYGSFIRHGGRMRIAVTNLKGGTGKTTTSIHLALELAKRGRTLLIDSDPQQSALHWSEDAAGWTLPTMALPVRDLNRRLPALAEPYDHAVVDTPPGELAIVRSALLACELAVIPIPPSSMDFRQLRPTIELIADLEQLNPDLRIRILLTRLRSGTRAGRDSRAILGELGLPVLATEIPLRESLSLAYGRVPDEAQGYDLVLAELLSEQVAA